ncbi:MAG TPA: hypothetical protein VE974_11815 [Thermoanaerobaculia bacterium]|nr:hypothetical protein [Thermoanaerobaculia bacterium]
MKRMNIMVDQALLEQARIATHERTYSGAIQKALEEIVRRNRFFELLDELSEAAQRGELWAPGFVEENFPEAAAELKREREELARANRVSDAPRTRSSEEGSRRRRATR